jgi:hypothetical protein
MLDKLTTKLVRVFRTPYAEAAGEPPLFEYWAYVTKIQPNVKISAVVVKYTIVEDIDVPTENK